MSLLFQYFTHVSNYWPMTVVTIPNFMVTVLCLSSFSISLFLAHSLSCSLPFSHWLLLLAFPVLDPIRCLRVSQWQELAWLVLLQQPHCSTPSRLRSTQRSQLGHHSNRHSKLLGHHSNRCSQYSSCWGLPLQSLSSVASSGPLPSPPVPPCSDCVTTCS